MTTGIDYITEYTSLRPRDDVRSITELVELERTSGYSDMSDEEISNLIAYKEYVAKRSEEIKLVEAKIKEENEMLKKSIEEQKMSNEEFMNAIFSLSPNFQTVENNEE